MKELASLFYKLEIPDEDYTPFNGDMNAGLYDKFES